MMLTRERRLEMFDEIYDLYPRYGISFDEFLAEIGYEFREEATNCGHYLIRACLDSAAEHMINASMDWYASTK